MIHHFPDAPFQVHLSYSFERCVGKWRGKRRLNQSPIIHWDQLRRESKHWICHSLWHTRKPSLCFCFHFFLLAIPLNMPLLTTPLTPGTHRLGISSIWFGFRLAIFFFSLFVDLPLRSILRILPDVSDDLMISCVPLCWEVHPPYHQTSRFLSHMNCLPPLRDHPRPLADWTIEPAPWFRHQNWS